MKYFLLGAIVLASGCASTRQIETASPRVFNTPESVEANVAGMSLLSVEMETGLTALPEEVDALRFRVDEVRLKSSNGRWLSFPAEQTRIEILPGRPLNKTLLTTRVLPADYDSLAIQIRDVFVLFGENAGSALTIPSNGVSYQSLELHVGPENPSYLRVLIEPGASLAKDTECRWHFVPFWRVE